MGQEDNQAPHLIEFPVSQTNYFYVIFIADLTRWSIIIFANIDATTLCYLRISAKNMIDQWDALRKMPVVLPEHLFPWLLERGHLPSHDEVSQYWTHMAEQQIQWVSDVINTGAMQIPLYLWGDDSVFNERNEKLVAVVCGSWLSDTKDSKDCVFPLFTYRYEPQPI